MKNFVKSSILTLAVVVCGLSVLTSCSKDDNYENLIVGTWDLVKYDANIVAKGEETIDLKALIDEYQLKNEAVSVTFNADGTWTGKAVAGGKTTEVAPGTYTVKDGEVKIGYDNHAYLILPAGGGTYTIESLTKKELVLSFVASFGIVDELNGATKAAVSSYKVVMTFTKR